MVVPAAMVAPDLIDLFLQLEGEEVLVASQQVAAVAGVVLIFLQTEPLAVPQ